MKLAIIGYGKMGRLIEQLAPEYGFTSMRPSISVTISPKPWAPMRPLSSPHPKPR